MTYILDDSQWASFPAIREALDAMESAKDKAAYSSAQDKLFVAQLRYDYHCGIHDMWNEYEQEQAAKHGIC